MSYAPLSDLPDYPQNGWLTPSSEAEVVLPLVTVTPLYGGGVRARSPDEVDVIRVPSIRGALRLWWRALEGPAHPDAPALYRAEREMWGGLSERPEEVTRSRVILAVEDVRATELNSDDISLQQADAYALWPARRTREAPPAPRRREGIRFNLRVRYPRPADAKVDPVRGAIRAWLLFGGLGGRTRRGCGAIAFPREAGAQRRDWLPENLEAATLAEFLEPKRGRLLYVSALSGARFCHGRPEPDALVAWYEAIKWLRDFRQGVHPRTVDTSVQGDHARMQPSLARGAAGRAGRSRWPEPDKIRHHCRPGHYDHAPLPGHGMQPAWPRAQFGLPIEVRFQPNPRPGAPPWPEPPPSPVALAWAWQQRKDNTWAPIDRLASPLVIRPVQLRDGSFVPLAIWLPRALPNGAKVGLYDRSGRSLDARSLADAKLVIAPKDTANFKPLAGKASVGDAFMEHLAKQPGVKGGKL